jgi:hypothetical protein
MNWESHWSNARTLAAHPMYPIHGALDITRASSGMSKGVMLGLGAAGVVAGAILGDLGLVLFLRGFGGTP